MSASEQKDHKINKKGEGSAKIMINNVVEFFFLFSTKYFHYIRPKSQEPVCHFYSKLCLVFRTFSKCLDKQFSNWNKLFKNYYLQSRKQILEKQILFCLWFTYLIHMFILFWKYSKQLKYDFFHSNVCTYSIFI